MFGTRSVSVSSKALEGNLPSTEPMQETSLERTQRFRLEILAQTIATHQVMHAMNCTSLEWEQVAIAITLKELSTKSRFRSCKMVNGNLPAIGPSGKAKAEILAMHSTMERCNVLVTLMVLIGYFRMAQLLRKLSNCQTMNSS